MTRSFPILLGAGFLAFFALGLAFGATTWLSVADLIVALGLFVTAIVSPHGSGELRGGVGMLLFGGLALTAWLGAITVDATSWLTGWTFGFGLLTQLCGFAAISMGGPFHAGWLVPPRRPHATH